MFWSLEIPFKTGFTVIINIHKRNNTKKTVHTIQNTVNTSTHITKTPTQCLGLPRDPLLINLTSSENWRWTKGFICLLEYSQIVLSISSGWAVFVPSFSPPRCKWLDCVCPQGSIRLLHLIPPKWDYPLKCRNEDTGSLSAKCIRHLTWKVFFFFKSRLLTAKIDRINIIRGYVILLTKNVPCVIFSNVPNYVHANVKTNFWCLAWGSLFTRRETNGQR